jgi:ABC-type branched-subunit amino acid transport system substrate-binding protein
MALAGCGATGRHDVSPATRPSTTLGPTVTIRIGYLGDLASGGTAVSRAVKDGELLAVQQFASDKTSVSVLIEKASTDGTTVGAAAAARRLIAEHVVAVVGPQSTREAEGSGPVLAAAGIASLSPSVTSTDLPSSGWPGFLRVVADDGQQGGAEADEIVEKLGRQQIALVTGAASGDQTRITSATDQIAVDGATVAVSVSLPSVQAGRSRRPGGRGAADAAADRVVAAGADGVLISASPAWARAVVAALVADGFRGSILVATDITTSTQALDGLGASADGAFLASPVDNTAAIAVNGGPALEFRDTFRAAFGIIPPPWAAEAYDASAFVLGAVSAGSTTAPLLRSYLGSHPWKGITSTLQFGPDGSPLHPHVWVSQVKDGIVTQIGEAS